MWQDVGVRYEEGWVYLDRVRDYNRRTPQPELIEYPQIHVSVTHMPISAKTGPKETHTEAEYLAIVPKFAINEEGLTPKIGRTFFSKGGVRYKVIAMNDYTHDPDYLCYMFWLQRDQLEMG